jgi:ABC-type sugar transport system ATPase subunit
MIQVTNLSIHVGGFRLQDVSLEVPTGSYCVLMGRTGCGKTTLLEAIAGLKPTVEGKVILDGRDVTQLKPAERQIGYVPQDGALFTTMSVRDHLGFALVVRRTPASQIARRVEELAEMLRIEQILGRLVAGLSGGERQRVALGRAISFHPATLLLDEPLSALDEETREQMYSLLKRVQTQTGVTILHVSHNTDDAKRLADSLYRVENGKIEQRMIQ